MRIDGPDQNQAQQALSPAQKTALDRLRAATKGFEGVFIGMLFKSMRATVSTDTLTGKQSQAEATFTDMLDDARAQSLAKSGSLGLARVLEGQLRASVLANAETESKAPLASENQP